MSEERPLRGKVDNGAVARLEIGGLAVRAGYRTIPSGQLEIAYFGRRPGNIEQAASLDGVPIRVTLAEQGDNKGSVRLLADRVE